MPVAWPWSTALTKAVLRYLTVSTVIRCNPVFLERQRQPRHPGHQPLSVEPDLPELLSRDELSEEEGDTLRPNCSHFLVAEKVMPSPCRWFFADISRGMHLVALHQPAEWSKSQSCLNLRQRAECSWSHKRIYLRQPIELFRCQSRVDILTLPCMLTRHWQTPSFDVKVRRIWHYIRLRSLTTEAARPTRCIMSGLQYPWDACFD